LFKYRTPLHFVVKLGLDKPLQLAQEAVKVKVWRAMLHYPVMLKRMTKAQAQLTPRVLKGAHSTAQT
jgi:hypothetical protein